MLHPFLAALASIAAVTAQVFVIDAQNGPGTNFVDISAAIAAVPEGAVLRVRAGLYGQFAIDGKSVTVLGDPGARILTVTGPVISNLQPQQSVCVRGLLLEPFFGGLGSGRFLLQGNQGSVCLDGIGTSFGQHRLVVLQSSQVRVRDCLFTGTVELTAADAVFDGCSFQAGNSTLPSLTQQGGRLQLSGCQVVGGPNFGQPAGTCVQLNGGELRVVGGGLTSSNVLGQPGLAVGGSGSVRLDPGVVVSAASPAFAAGVSVTTIAMPQLTAVGAPLGGTITAAVNGPLGSLAALSVAFPGSALLIPGVVDPLFWDLATAVNQAIGIPLPNAPLTSQIVVPVDIAFVGAQLVHHGITLDAAAGLQISAPASTVVR